MARVVKIAKMSHKGTHQLSELTGLNECAESKKRSMVELARQWEEDARKSHMKTRAWLLGATILAFVFNETWGSFWLFPAVILLIAVVGFRRRQPEDSGNWLQRSMR